MNIYHITQSRRVGIAHLHFWGCNLNCRACLLKKELYDCHLPETKDGIFNAEKISPQKATSIARKHLDHVSCLTGNEELKFEVLRVI
jgi:pyruvate formate lyase activating enzyme